ncbi:MAG: hypothetical protein ACLU7E_18880 [Clostridium butyricum]
MNKKFISSLLSIMLVMGISPICASAEWRSNSHGWWYSKGNSWAIGWEKIGDNWYYFNKDGYMLSNIIIDGYVLGIDGVWIENDPVTEAYFPVNRTNIKNYKITIFYDKETGEIKNCLNGVKTYSDLDTTISERELSDKYGIVRIPIDVEVLYGYENYKVVNGEVIYRNI